MSGEYTTVGPSESVKLSAQLIDTFGLNSTYLFNNSQVSAFGYTGFYGAVYPPAPDPTFILGGQAGDLSNTLSSGSSLTGFLYPGHTYTWSYDAEIYIYYSNLPEATATGNVTLSFSSVPEPASLLIWSLLGGSGIAIGWWRRRKAG